MTLPNTTSKDSGPSTQPHFPFVPAAFPFDWPAVTARRRDTEEGRSRRESFKKVANCSDYCDLTLSYTKGTRSRAFRRGRARDAPRVCVRSWTCTFQLEHFVSILRDLESVVRVRRRSVPWVELDCQERSRNEIMKGRWLLTAILKGTMDLCSMTMPMNDDDAWRLAKLPFSNNFLSRRRWLGVTDPSAVFSYIPVGGGMGGCVRVCECEGSGSCCSL